MIKTVKGSYNKITIRNTGQKPVPMPVISVGEELLWYSIDDMAAYVRQNFPDTDEGRAVGAWIFLKERLYHHLNAGYTTPVYDIVDIVNSYGFGGCTQVAAAMMQLWMKLGLKTREVGILGYHNMSEVFYNGGWHLFDADEKAVYLDEDNRTVSNIEKLHANPSLVARIIDPAGILKNGVLYNLPFLLENNARDIYALEADSFRIQQAAVSAHRENKFQLLPGDVIVFTGGKTCMPVWTSGLNTSLPQDWSSGYLLRTLKGRAGEELRTQISLPWVISGALITFSGEPMPVILGNVVKGKNEFAYKLRPDRDADITIKVKFQISGIIMKNIFNNGSAVKFDSHAGNAEDIDVEFVSREKAVVPEIKLSPVLPVDASIISGANALFPILVWKSNASEGTVYRIQVGTSGDFSDPLSLVLIEDTFSEDTAWQVPVFSRGSKTLYWLNPDTEYHWRVMPVTKEGEGQWAYMGKFRTRP